MGTKKYRKEVDRIVQKCIEINNDNSSDIKLDREEERMLREEWFPDSFYKRPKKDALSIFKHAKERNRRILGHRAVVKEREFMYAEASKDHKIRKIKALFESNELNLKVRIKRLPSFYSLEEVVVNRLIILPRSSVDAPYSYSFLLNIVQIKE